MKIWNVMEYGVKADGKTNDGPCIQRAVDDCSAAFPLDIIYVVPSN